MTDQETIDKATRIMASTPPANLIQALAHAGLLHPSRPRRPAGAAMSEDAVNHPAHYTSHPSGIECIQVTEHMGFNIGNAVKYLWRADLKGHAIEDLRKAAWYVQREIDKRQEQP